MGDEMGKFWESGRRKTGNGKWRRRRTRIGRKPDGPWTAKGQQENITWETCLSISTPVLLLAWFHSSLKCLLPTKRSRSPIASMLLNLVVNSQSFFFLTPQSIWHSWSLPLSWNPVFSWFLEYHSLGGTRRPLPVSLCRFLLVFPSPTTEMPTVLSLNLFSTYAHSFGDLIQPCSFKYCWYMATPKCYLQLRTPDSYSATTEVPGGESWSLGQGIRIYWQWWWQSSCSGIHKLNSWPSHLTSWDLSFLVSKRRELDLVSISQTMEIKTEILWKMGFGGQMSYHAPLPGLLRGPPIWSPCFCPGPHPQWCLKRAASSLSVSILTLWRSHQIRSLFCLKPFRGSQLKIS